MHPRSQSAGNTGRKGQSDPIRSRLWSAEIRDTHLKMWKCENVSQCYALGRILASTNFANSNRRQSRPFFYEAPFRNWGEAHRASRGVWGRCKPPQSGVSPCKTRRPGARGATILCFSKESRGEDGREGCFCGIVIAVLREEWSSLGTPQNPPSLP